MCCYWLNDYCNILQTQLREKLWEQLQEKHLIAVNSEERKKKENHKAGAGKSCKARDKFINVLELLQRD